MGTGRLQRQSFLGEGCESTLAGRRAAIVGLGGGGSHVIQQLAHIGIGAFVNADPDVVELSNLNRLVGATQSDVTNATPKVDVAKRIIHGINPTATVTSIQDKWQSDAESLRDCDVIFGCVDRYDERDQLERLARRFLIPYLDIGMDVHRLENGYVISGQISLSMPDMPCLWCMGLMTEDLLQQEADRYGEAGDRPQVIWPNGILASTAVGIFMQLVTPWHQYVTMPILFEYDGNSHETKPSNKMSILNETICKHFTPTEVGDPFF